MRLLALLVLLAVLPTAEVVEQLVHVVEHAIELEATDHSAHHDDSQSDEHGCTGLIHLCSSQHVQVTAAVGWLRTAMIETQEAMSVAAPSSLVDLNSLEPPHRPPIG